MPLLFFLTQGFLNMPDFSALLRTPAPKAEKPPNLPIGDYPGIVKSFEVSDNNKNKTPFVRFQLGLLDWPSTVPESDRLLPSGTPIDLSKRQQRRDFYITEDARWRLHEFMQSCGVDPEGRPYEETFPELVGAPVLVEITTYINQRTNEEGTQVGKVIGEHSK